MLRVISKTSLNPPNVREQLFESTKILQLLIKNSNESLLSRCSSDTCVLLIWTGLVIRISYCCNAELISCDFW